MKKILITGANGYIGGSLWESLKKFYNVITVTRKDFDLTDCEATKKFFHGKYFDIVINTSIVGGHRQIPDSADIIAQNAKMYWNIIANKASYDKFIGFGSGAELGMPNSQIQIPNTYYGISKKIISDLMYHEKNCLNLRLFAVFDHNEISTRFIKSNLQRYINHEDMIVHNDMFMDFFYMEDLINLVKYFIDQSEWKDKVIDCRYQDSPKLSDITSYINSLDDYQVNVKVGETNNKMYIGAYKNLPIKFIGLKEGINHTYKILKNKQ
jgi:dTDP-4-dehydrorhamnose reductase